MKNHLYLVKLTYTKDLTFIDNLMKPHVDFLKKYYKLNKFIFSGRQIPRTGGIILCSADTREEVEDILREDPFVNSGAANYEIITFQASMYSGKFKSVLEHLK